MVYPAVQAQVLRVGVTPCQFVLAVAVQHVQLRLQGIGVVKAVRARRQVDLVVGAAEVAQRSPMVARQQAEARFHPALQYRGLAAVRIEHPAAQHVQVVGLFALQTLRIALQSGLVRVIEKEGCAHEVLEGMRAPARIPYVIQQFEEMPMHGAHAVQFQGGGVLLKGQAAEDLRRQVAAVDRQSRTARQAYAGIRRLCVFIHTFSLRLSGSTPYARSLVNVINAFKTRY